MEDAAKEKQPLAPGSARKSILKYPLRSATKSKEQKPPARESAISSAPRRGRSTSIVSQSVSALDLSGKEKSAKPPRRLSIPTKASVTPSSKQASSITPISESRPKRPANPQPRSGTPFPDAWKSASGRKISDLLKPSYWLSQIKLSESAAKHSISLGFFKLALEAGCEPLSKMRDELRSYTSRHDLGELGESVKQLFEAYNISENSEQLQVSETCSQVPKEEGTQSSFEEDVHSSSSTVEAELKPKSLNNDSPPAPVSTEPEKDSQLKPKSLNNDSPPAPISSTEPEKDIASKKNPTTKTRASWIKNSANTRPVPETGGRKVQKKSQTPAKPELKKDVVGKSRTKKLSIKKSATEEGASALPAAADSVSGNKENVDAL